MFRTLGPCLLVFALPCSWANAAEEKKSSPREAVALQETLQKAIEDAEPSIACILVSRSKKYEKEFGQGPSIDVPGKLGIFKFDYSRYTDRDFPRRKLAVQLDLSSANTIPESFGSGVVVDEKQGQILTAYHVVIGATKIYVRLPGGKASYANILAADPRSDLAVLQLIDKLTLKAVKIGDASKIRKGQMVLTIANPHAAGFEDGSPSASWGIVSNIRRRAPGKNYKEWRAPKSLHFYGTLIQTDTRLNLGCSGGALINLEGELIGLTTSVAAITGTDVPGGFAMPIDGCMRRVVDTLKQGREVEYGFLGVSFGDSFLNNGVYLTTVIRNSPARDAGMLERDRILKINGTPVHSNTDVFLPLASFGPKSRVRFEIERTIGNIPRKLTLTATLSKFLVTGDIIAQNIKYFRGLRVEYTSFMVQGKSMKSLPPNGVLVQEVKPNSPASGLLLPGDVILEVNGTAVKDPADFHQKVRHFKGRVEFKILNKETPVKIN